MNPDAASVHFRNLQEIPGPGEHRMLVQDADGKWRVPNHTGAVWMADLLHEWLEIHPEREMVASYLCRRMMDGA